MVGGKELYLWIGRDFFWLGRDPDRGMKKRATLEECSRCRRSRLPLPRPVLRGTAIEIMVVSIGKIGGQCVVLNGISSEPCQSRLLHCLTRSHPLDLQDQCLIRWYVEGLIWANGKPGTGSEFRKNTRNSIPGPALQSVPIPGRTRRSGVGSGRILRSNSRALLMVRRQPGRATHHCRDTGLGRSSYPQALIRSGIP
jgi:hypothetical protein